MVNLHRIASARRAVLLMAAAIFIPQGMCPHLFAQNAAPTPPHKGLQILLLGTHGGPALTQQRSEPATLLIVDGRPYLIDCGIGTMRRLLDASVPSQSIATIFITHNHPDHALGLADVLANDYRFLDLDAPASHQVFNIYGPPQTQALVSAAFRYIAVPYSIFSAEPIGRSALFNPFHAHVFDHDGLVYQDDKIRVTATENSHFQLMPAKYHPAMKSYSYRFDTAYGTVVFTGDTGPSPAVEALAQNADVLISEVEDLDAIVKEVRGGEQAGNPSTLVQHMQVEHLPTKAVGELASKSHVKALILDHYVGSQDAQRFAAEVKKYYSGALFAGEDLARYCLAADTAASAHAGKLTPCSN